jgi:hypothetical protein
MFWPLGLFWGHLVYFPRFGMFHHEKSGNPDSYNLFYGRNARVKIKVKLSAVCVSQNR